MRLTPPRFGVLMLGDRLVAALIQGATVETFVIEAENPAVALRAELDARKLKPRTVAIGVARPVVTVKPIELPPIGGELRDMVKFELERHLPFAADDATFDFTPLPANGGPSPAGPTRRVLLIAADRRVVDSALRLAQEAKLRPVSVTVAAHNLPALAQPRGGQKTVWVHRAAGAADLLLLDGDRLVLSRVAATAEDSVIADEIRRSLPLARWREIDAVWLSGDPALGTVGAGALGALGAPITEPPLTRRGRLLLTPAGEDGATELAIAVAAGRRARPLELLPEPLRPKRLTRTQALTAGALAATVLLGLGALLVPGYRENRRLSTVNREVARLDPQVRAVERTLRELERQRGLLTTIEKLSENSVRPLPVLRELTELVPADAWLTTLSLDGKGVEITGQAGAASALIPILENSPRLERVEFASPVTRGRDKEQFRIRAAWEPGGAARAAVGITPEPPPGARRPTPPGSGVAVPPPGSAPPTPGLPRVRAMSPGLEAPPPPPPDEQATTPPRRPFSPTRMLEERRQ